MRERAHRASDRAAIGLRRLAALLLQLVLLAALAYAGDWTANRLHLPLPGSILAMLVLFLLLQLRIVPMRWVERGGDWYIRHLLLFFIPPAMGIMGYANLLRTEGIAIVLTVLISTALVMTGVGLVAEQVSRRTANRWGDGAVAEKGREAR